jgi:4-diphosphocytidyl-2-C-methyl-D-erythritol kinase
VKPRSLLYTLALNAHAKINLTLEVLARRDDGYHALRSVMVPVALDDDLSFERGERFAFDCEPRSLLRDNLVNAALVRLGLGDAPISVTLRKRIPVGAGLGGGSSDAAGVLRAAMSGAFGAQPERDWVGEARALGSDVPFFLVDGPALVEGAGERVTALGAAPPWWIVLLVPGTAISTAGAYAALAAARSTAPARSRPRHDSPTLRCGEALQRGDFAGVLAALTNDFEPVVRAAHAPVDAALRALDAAGAPGRAMLSGSGAACFALLRTQDDARALAARLRLPDGAAVHVVPFAQSGAWR